MEWFKLSRPRAARRPAVQAPQVDKTEVETSALEVRMAEAIPVAATTPESPMPALPLPIPAATPAPVVAKSPKAVFDTVADQPRPFRSARKPKLGFTISSSKNGETQEVELTSPTLAVARARMLSKSGWHVEITNAAGRLFVPAEFDDVLKFD